MTTATPRLNNAACSYSVVKISPSVKTEEEGGTSKSNHLLAVIFVLAIATMMVSSFGILETRGDSEVSTIGTNNINIEDPLTIVKLKGGPKASEVIRAVICDGYDNVWHHWVENSGLKALKVSIYEGFAANGQLVYSENIEFADYGAFPNGVVQLPDFQPTHALLYNYVYDPVGHKNTQALYYYDVEAKYAPVPVVTSTSDFTTWNLDASGSYDPDGWIVSFEWYWSGGGYATGPIVSLAVSPGGFFTATLVITDNDGLEGGMILNHGWW